MDPREFRFKMLCLLFEISAALPAGWIIGHAWRRLLEVREGWDLPWQIAAEILLAGATVWVLSLGGWHVRRVAKGLALRFVGETDDEER